MSIGTRASRRILASLAVAGCLVTTACTSAAPKSGSPTSAGSSSTTGGASSAPASSAQASSQGKTGGTLVVAQSVDASPKSFLSPALGNILTEYSVFETLTLTDVDTGQPKPVLAKSWTTSSDGLQMAIQLRDDVTFHDGRKMTSADVLYTLQQVQDPAVSPQGAPLASNIASMKANGDYEVDLTFKKPMPNVFDLFEIMPIVDKNTFANIGAGKVVNGTGPYMWKSWTPGGEIVLQKYPQYRDAAHTALDTIDINIITDPTAELAALQSGRVQYAFGLTALNATTLAKQSGYALLKTGGASFPICFNTTTAPFDNKSVRQAVQYAIDRDRIVAQAESGEATATDLPWKATTLGLDPSQSTQYTYQPDKAKQLLAAAGVKSGTSFNMVTLNTPEVVAIMQIIKNNLAAVGLNANVQALSDSDFNERVSKVDMGAPVFLLQAGSAFSPVTQVQIRPELLASGNTEHFQTAEYTSLVNALTSAVSPSQEQTALHAYAAYYLDQAFCVPVVSRQTLSVRSTSVDGIVGTSYGFINLSNAYLTK
jgi:peptide/nickel transport system substrate-binding protein